MFFIESINLLANAFSVLDPKRIIFFLFASPKQGCNIKTIQIKVSNLKLFFSFEYNIFSVKTQIKIIQS